MPSDLMRASVFSSSTGVRRDVPEPVAVPLAPDSWLMVGDVAQSGGLDFGGVGPRRGGL